MSIRVLITGAAGRMGREVVRAIHEQQDMEVVGAVDAGFHGENPGVLAGIGPIDGPVRGNLETTIQETKPQVMVDFTVPSAVMQNVRTALSYGVRAVVGTTGLTTEDMNELEALCAQCNTACLVAPNFAVGAVLMMKFAAEAAKYMPDVEIIELHHNRKADAPSGTALLTAEMIAANRPAGYVPEDATEIEKVPGARGGELNGISIHSVRLPGYVAHQEVIFGGLGQILTIRHDSLDRRSFMPGVVLAVREIIHRRGLIYGLEKIL